MAQQAKGLAAYARQLEFDLQDPHEGGRRKPTSQNLSSDLHTCNVGTRDTHTYTRIIHTKRNTFKEGLAFKFNFVFLYQV